MISVYARDVIGKRCDIGSNDDVDTLLDLRTFRISLDNGSTGFDFDEEESRGRVWFGRGIPAQSDADHLAYATRAVLELGQSENSVVAAKVRAAAPNGNEIDGTVDLRDCDATIGSLQVEVLGIPDGAGDDKDHFLRTSVTPVEMPIAEETAHQTESSDSDAVSPTTVDDLQMGSYTVTVELKRDGEDAALMSGAGVVEVKPGATPSTLIITLQ